MYVTEAMASGLAVISFDYAAGHEHIRSGNNGLLAPFGNDSQFINNAITLLDSPNLLKTLREQARENRSDDFSGTALWMNFSCA